jgi:hypothetical protein
MEERREVERGSPNQTTPGLRRLVLQEGQCGSWDFVSEFEEEGACEGGVEELSAEYFEPGETGMRCGVKLFASK